MNINETIDKIMTIKTLNEDMSIIDIILSEVQEEEDLEQLIEAIQSPHYRAFREYIKRDAIDKKYITNYQQKKNLLNELF